MSQLCVFFCRCPALSHKHHLHTLTQQQTKINWAKTVHRSHTRMVEHLACQKTSAHANIGYKTTIHAKGRQKAVNTHTIHHK